jgi:adenylate cyclase
MSSGNPAVKRSSKPKLSSSRVGFLIVLAVFLCTLTVRRTGLLQFLEFQAYDFCVRYQPKASTSEPIVLVEMTESDIHSPSLDYPIYDDKLAELLRDLEADHPAVIGLDIWRDIPVPKSGAHLNELNQVLQTYSNIIAIFTLGGIGPPPILKSDPDRVAFNDNFPADVEVDRTIPKVRRTLLFATLGGQNFDSLPFRVASLYLEKKGIEPQPDPGDPKAFRLGKARLRAFQSNDGAYVGADAHGWQMLLDFKCPDQFTRYSVSEAISGHIPAGTLRDKIILIGMNSPSVSDERVTPIRRDHRGIEVQALTINQLLRSALDGEKPLRFWNDWFEGGWILLWCIIGCTIAYRVRSPWRFAIISVVGLACLAGIAWIAFMEGWWIPVVAPAAAYIPAAGLAIAYVSSQERSMRAILMKLYSGHVSKEIAELTWANRDSFLEAKRPIAQKLTITVLFTDLKGFSTISEKFEPAQLYEWLNEYLGAMAQVIQEHAGVLKQFAGDGILALFGVPLPHTTLAEQASDAAAAVNCALGMGRRLVELSHRWEEVGLPLVSMRAGIYTGEVAAGSVGSEDRYEYTAIGDVVNTASRLESYDKTLADPDLLPNRCRILIGAPTHDLLGGKYLSKEIGWIEVKGKANKVLVFQILDDNNETFQRTNAKTDQEIAPLVPKSKS